MHFATCFPDWNSLDSVRRAHSDLEGAALIFFALLVVFDVLAHLSAKDRSREVMFEKIGLCCFAVAVLAEIVAYPYGQRNDTLSEQIIGSLDAKAREAASNASAALTKSETALSHSSEAETKSSGAVEKAGKAQEKVEAVSKRAEKIDAGLALTQWLLSARSITDLNSMIDQLKQYKGQLVHLRSYSIDDAPGFCNALWFAAHSAEMDAKDECGTVIPEGMPLIGVAISGPNIQQTIDMAQILARTANTGVGGIVSAIKAPELAIFVGVRPPFGIGQVRGVNVPTKKQAKKQSAKP